MVKSGSLNRSGLTILDLDLNLRPKSVRLFISLDGDFGNLAVVVAGVSGMLIAGDTGLVLVSFTLVAGGVKVTSKS